MCLVKPKCFIKLYFIQTIILWKYNTIIEKRKNIQYTIWIKGKYEKNAGENPKNAMSKEWKKRYSKNWILTERIIFYRTFL